MDSTETVMHETYLPVTEATFVTHFAPIRGGAPDRSKHLKYYVKSIQNWEMFNARSRRIGHTAKPAAVARALQMEKDERFWIAAALLGVFYPEEGRVDRLTRLLKRTFGDSPPAEDMHTWSQFLEGELHLYFEVSTPSPPDYKAWLRDRLDELILVPYLREAAERAGLALEGATKVDAMLVSDRGSAVFFEAKVLSDASTGIRYDPTRNQIARTIDVMLGTHGNLAHPLDRRDPARTCLALVTPRLFQQQPHSRLYGRLMNEYRNDPSTIGRDLPHRDNTEWADVARRLGWLTFEDIEDTAPGSCRWLA